MPGKTLQPFGLAAKAAAAKAGFIVRYLDDEIF
jgi:hypothetical protein